MSESVRPQRSVTVLLVFAMCAGLAMAGFGLLNTADDADLPPQAVASISGQIITQADYQRALDAADADRRTPLDDRGRREVLDRLINEALLIQHGLDQGLVRQSPRLRDQLVDTVLSGIRAEADATEFSQADLEEFYRRNAALFRGPDLLNVALVFSRTQDKAKAVRAAMDAGDDWEVIRLSAGTDGIPMPVSAVPADKLRDYIGPTLTQRAQALEVGEAAGPFAYQDGYAVLKMADRHSAPQPPLEQVEAAVRTQIHRREAERLLQQRLTALRGHYDVIIADEAR